MSITGDPSLTETALCNFIAQEVAMLDEGQWDQWLQLFTDDGRYWVPQLGRMQEDDVLHSSIAFEDLPLLELRIRRLRDSRALSEHLPSRCQHVLQVSKVEDVDREAGTAVLRTPFLYIEARGEEQWMLAGSFRHVLVSTPEGLRMRQKRVDLLGAERALPSVQLPI